MSASFSFRFQNTEHWRSLQYHFLYSSIWIRLALVIGLSNLPAVKFYGDSGLRQAWCFSRFSTSSHDFWLHDVTSRILNQSFQIPPNTNTSTACRTAIHCYQIDLFLRLYFNKWAQLKRNMKDWSAPMRQRNLSSVLNLTRSVYTNWATKTLKTWVECGVTTSKTVSEKNLHKTRQCKKKKNHTQRTWRNLSRMLRTRNNGEVNKNPR